MLKIGLPAGAEFAMMAVYLMLVYVIAKPFGSAAQAGFGIGMRVVQALFMPVVALGFAVAPVAGQNFGARRGDRVKARVQDRLPDGAAARCSLMAIALQHRAGRARAAVLEATRRSSPSATNTCASSRGTSSPRA